MPKNEYDEEYFFHFNYPDGQVKTAMTYIQNHNTNHKAPITRSFQELRESNEIEIEPNKSVRIYVRAHGNATDILASGAQAGREFISLNELVELLIPILKNLGKDNYLNCTPQPLLSLMVCHAAQSPELLESFAANLQRALAENGIYVNVNARVPEMLCTRQKFIVKPAEAIK